MGDRDIREEFNVEEARRREYGDFIDRLRSLLAGNRMVRNCPVLPRAADIPSNHQRFEIVLRTNGNEITLLFRRRDLYLEAYRSSDSAAWLEFQERNQTNHVVEGSEFLGFDGSYVGNNGLEATGARRNKQGEFVQGSGARESIPLGRYALRDAVNSLGTSNARDVRARSLLVIIQMISESLRFEAIQYFILDYWYEGATPSSRLLALENSWGRFSDGLLRSDAHPDLAIFPIRQVYNAIVHNFTFEIVVSVMGLIGNSVRQSRGKRSVGSADDEDGRALLEVFEVIINNIDGESLGDLYGTIEVTDGQIPQYIYNRERDHTESIKPNQKATLTGPTEASISALDNFIIEVALMDRDSFPDPSPDDEVSKGEIAWSVYDINTNVYDQPVPQTIFGAKGSVTVVYGVLGNAVQAHVEVTMINGDEEDPADVYGSIVAGYNNPDFKNQESVLFHRDRGDVIEVGKGAVIPLSRSIVAVPLNCQLIIRADLLDRDTTIFNPDDEIANGTKNFPAKLSGEVYGFIDGEYGQIKVKVTWIP